MTENSSASGGMLQTATLNTAEDVNLDLLLGDWISQLTGLPRNLCRRRWQESPPVQPARDTDWCALGVTTVTPDQNIAATFKDNVYTLHLHETIEALFSFYGINASQNAMSLRVGLNIGANRTFLTNNGMTFLRSSDVRRVPAIINQLTLMRSDISMQFRRQEQRTYPIQSVLVSDGYITTTDGFNCKFSTEYAE